MLLQAILIGLVAALGVLGDQMGSLYINRPIILAPLVGLIVGNLEQSIVIGASLELFFMWWRDWEVDNTNTIGQRYGATVKKYDLMNKLLDGLTNEPYTRRHIIDLYQYADFEETAGLHPCAFLTVWSARGEYLDVTLHQR